MSTDFKYTKKRHSWAFLGSKAWFTLWKWFWRLSKRFYSETPHPCSHFDTNIEVVTMKIFSASESEKRKISIYLNFCNWSKHLSLTKLAPKRQLIILFLNFKNRKNILKILSVIFLPFKKTFWEITFKIPNREYQIMWLITKMYIPTRHIFFFICAFHSVT